MNGKRGNHMDSVKSRKIAKALPRMMMGAVLAAVIWVFSIEAQAGSHRQGKHIQGPTLQGRQIQGIRLQGMSEQGLSLQGMNEQGLSLQGWMSRA